MGIKKYVELNGEARITGYSDEDYPQEGQALFEFPEGFDFSRFMDYRLVNGELIEDVSPEPDYAVKQQINELKARLSETDYAVIKIAEGAATLTDYAQVIEERRSWREQINALEAQE